MTQITFLLLLLLFIPHSSSRRILHQPFIPATDPPPPPPIITTQPPSLSPSPQPLPQPKHPFSSLSPPSTTTPHYHFFPFYTTPPTTTVPSTSLPTFPANISSIILPPPSSKSHVSKKLIFSSLTLSLLSIIFIATIVATLLYHRTNNHNHHKPPNSDNLRLFPANLPTSDKPPPTLSPNFSTPSSEFLYVGTLISPLHDQQQLLKTSTNVYSGATSASVGYDMMGSPELHPLPPLPRQDFRHENNIDDSCFTDSEVEGNEQFFSPKGSPVVLHRQKTVVPPPPPPVPQFRFSEEVLKPKLKGLDGNKLVKSSSEKAMVWDHLKFSSFKLDEEKIETLFKANSSNHSTKQTMAHHMAADMSQKNRVLDPHKSRNIAILLRAFNLTIDEVCECILQGNVDSLGSELLGSLLKMAPTTEEEVRLKEFNDASIVELDPEEKFINAVISIPFAFKRVDAMLYISNFDTEAEYLKGSFVTIKLACGQLRNNKMFIKLLEAVQVACNRMNIGTNSGDAHAFNLDTLLKLIDVKGTDGKTTLLHFVVQEITRAEGRLSEANQQSELCDEVESTKRGLEVVSRLGWELSSVKKAATMDSDLLSKEVGRLAMSLTKIHEVVSLIEQYGSNKRFSDSMNMFLKKAGDDIVKIEAEERVSVSMVRETTEYFLGNSAMEEGQPLRIFMVVRDFLLVLDRVCKDVGKINERTTVGSQCHPMSQSLPSVFPRSGGQLDFGSFDGEDDSTTG